MTAITMICTVCGAAVLSLRRTLRNRLLLRLYGWLQGSARSPGAQPAAPDEVRELLT